MTVYRLTDLPALIPLYRADNASVFGVENRKLRFCIPNMLTQDCGMKIPGTWTFLTKNSPDLYEPSRSVVTVRNDAVALRQEIPFECWFADHGCNEPLTKKEAVKARFWALLALLEGALVTLIASVVVLALKIYSKVASKQHPSIGRRVTILNAQWQGLKLSAVALISPSKAKFKANFPHPRYEDRRPCIGKLLSDWTRSTWGTVYLGKRVPFSHL